MVDRCVYATLLVRRQRYTAGGDLAEQPGAISINITGDSPDNLELNDLAVLNTAATDADLDPAVAGGLAAPSGALDERRLRMVAKATTSVSSSSVPSVLAPLGTPRTASPASAVAARTPAPAPAPTHALGPPALPSQASPARSTAPTLAPYKS